MPLAFLCLGLLATLGGVLYAPTNFDALAYRISRMLHWMAAEQWHWIETYDSRMNSRVCGFEWLTMPLLIFTNSDRWLFLVNVVSFFLLPGLIYSVFTRLGVNRRVTWVWMWLMPSAYVFVLQAGSIANDLFAAVYALAAVDLALRARETGRPRLLWLSGLAAGLLTGAKNSNLPLLLPWFLAVLPSWRLILSKPFSALAVSAIALFVSFLPTALLNHKFCGDWTGYSTEGRVFMVSNPALGVAGNTLMLFIQNFVPPIFPFAGKWNSALPASLPSSAQRILEENFELGALQLREMPQEEYAGLGFGISILLAVSVCALLFRKNLRRSCCSTVVHSPIGFRRLIAWSAYVSLLAFMAKSGINSAARLICPYYALLLPALLQFRGHRELIRRRWWNFAVAAVFALSYLVVILTPARPLWPAQTILSKLSQARPNDPLLQRAERVYRVYAQRADGLAPVRALIPPGERSIGLVTSGGDTEASLWRPFGSRRIRYVFKQDTPETLRAAGVRFVIVNSEGLRVYYELTLEAWLRRYEAEVLDKVSIALTVSRDPTDWYLVRLHDTKSVRYKPEFPGRRAEF